MVINHKKLIKLLHSGWQSGGWENHWGDWLKADKKKFPSGLKEVAQKIKGKGLKPGIWIAPFLVNQNSEIIKNHPDWLVKTGDQTTDGLRVTVMDEYFPYKRDILDVTNPEVLDYIDKVLE